LYKFLTKNLVKNLRIEQARGDRRVPNGFNRLYALDLLFQAKIAANTGTSSIFDAHHDGDHVCALKNRWSTRLYCTFGFHDKSLMHKAG